MVALVLLSSCSGGGASSTQGTSSAPMQGSAQAAKASVQRTVERRGKTIAFCGPTCLRKFDRMSDAEKDAMLRKATTYAAAP